MAEAKKAETIELTIVIALAVFAAVFAYFRFFYEKDPGTGNPGSTSSSVVSLEVPKIDYPPPEQGQLHKTLENSSQLAKIRDIFSPLKLLDRGEGKEKPVERPVPAFSLSGTILGGGSPVAIINSKFVRLGNQIDGFEVTMISKDQVHLRSGDREIVLEVLKQE